MQNRCGAFSSALATPQPMPVSPRALDIALGRERRGQTTASPDTDGVAETTSPVKKAGIAAVTSDKKQPPFIKTGATQAPSTKMPVAKRLNERKNPRANCIGLGCGDGAPACIGLGCGETEPMCIGLGCGDAAPQCIGTGCENKGAVNPQGTRTTGTATLPSVKKPTIYGADPCCSILTIGANGLVTARDSATGKTFQFHATNQAVRNSLRIGQKIHADFGTQQVSVDGLQPCCAIVSVSGGPAGAATKP